MAEFFRAALSALPAVASSPLAFVAYLVVVLAWGVIAWKVSRSRQLLRNLEKFPAADRLKAWQLETGSYQMVSGISPEQFVRLRVYWYLFLGFSIVFLSFVILFVVSATSRLPGTGFIAGSILVISALVLAIAGYLMRPKGKVSVDITPYAEPRGDHRI